MSDVDQIEAQLKERLADWRAPGESAAEERSRRLATSDFARRPASTRRRISLRVGIVGLLTAAVAGFALSPAGAKVGDLVSDAVGTDEPATPVRLGGLPDVGQLLVASDSGLWIVDEDGSRHSLGAYDDAVFSPHGLFIAATSGRQLTAIDPEGESRWSIDGDAPILFPAWSQSGFRIAYLDGGSVHVVAGDGTEDTWIAGPVNVGAVWRPPPAAQLRASIDGVGTHQLTYADMKGRVLLIDTDSGRELWRTPISGKGNAPAEVKNLSWSTNGSRLLVETSDGYAVLRRDGSLVVQIGGARLGDVAISADGSRVATVSPRGRSRIVAVQGSSAGSEPSAKVFSGPGPITDLDWSPHGRTLAIGWKATGEWIFIRPGARANGVTDIADEFDASKGTLPRIEDWCCRDPG